MALISSSSSYLNCYCKVSRQTTPRISGIGFSTNKEDLAFRLPCLETKIITKKPIAFHKNLRINVASPNAPLTITTEILDAFEDEYDGAIINPDCLPDTSNAFAAMLQSSLSYWRIKGKKGIWLKLLEDQANLVPIALKAGFSYHHAEPGYVMLTYWIPDEPCMLPSTATHQAGVGGFVINDNREVLVVKEKKCPLRCSGIWKLPTGHIDKSEDIFSAAIREVKEETGIDTSFLEVVAFRHAHQVAFEKSDLLFICMLKPLSFNISIDETEIQAAMWMPLDEFLNQPYHLEDKMAKNIIDICAARHQNKYLGFTAQQMMSKLDDRMSYLYYRDLKDLTEENLEEK